MGKISDIINVDPDILGGQPVFKNTRVPIESLFDHLENGYTLSEFLDDFPTVTKSQALSVIDLASKILSSKDLLKIYEAAA